MTFRQKSSYWIVQLWPLLNTGQEIVSIIFSCNNIISTTFWVMSGSCQGLFNRPVCDEPTKSRGIKTEQILSSFLWLVSLSVRMSCLKLDYQRWKKWIWILVFNATFSNISAISWRPVLVVEEAGVPEENHRPWASNW